MNVLCSRHSRFAAGCPLLFLLLLCMGCHQRVDPLEEELSRTPPTSPIKYSRVAVERIVRSLVTKEYPFIAELRIGVYGPHTEFPAVKKGRPVYFCLVKGYIILGRQRVAHTPTYVVDATTGEVLDMSYEALHPYAVHSGTPPQGSAKTPPISSIRYSKSDAQRLARAALTKENLDLVIRDMSVRGYWTDYPGVKKGRPIYQCIAHVELLYGRARESYAAVLVVDATTGEIVKPEVPGQRSPKATGTDDRRSSEAKPS